MTEGPYIEDLAEDLARISSILDAHPGYASPDSRVVMRIADFVAVVSPVVTAEGAVRFSRFDAGLSFSSLTQLHECSVCAALVPTQGLGVHASWHSSEQGAARG